MGISESSLCETIANVCVRPLPHHDRIVDSPLGRKKTVRVRVLERNTRAAALESFSRCPRFNNDDNNIAIDYRNREFDSPVRVWRPSTNGMHESSDLGRIFASCLSRHVVNIPIFVLRYKIVSMSQQRMSKHACTYLYNALNSVKPAKL